MDVGLFFVRSGAVHIPASSAPYLANTGNAGYYWPSTPYSAAGNAYALAFITSANVQPSTSGNSRLAGHSLRCLAR